MTMPADDVLRELVTALTQRKAEFAETAADMQVVGMPATIGIDEVLDLIRELAKVEVPPALHLYRVAVEAATPEQADHVMGERLGFDEDYGFDYQITSWRRLDSR